MKIAYLALSEVYGGNDAGFAHTHNVVYFLLKAKVDVTLFIGAPEKEIKTDVKSVFVKLPRISNIFRVNPVSYFRSFFEVKKQLNGVDIVHERFHVNPIDLLLIGKRKYVLEVNDPAIELCSGVKKIFYRWLVRMKYDRADAIIVQTETLKEIVSRHTKTKIFVIPNGVDIDRFRPDVKSDMRRKYGISSNDLVVTFVGSFREWHGVLDIVEIAKKIPSAKFLLVGKGPLYNDVKEAASDVDNMILAGAACYDELPGILAGSDILIAPFNTKHFKQLEKYGFFWCPVKLFEYMASGKPVVSYDFPEVRKIVGDGGMLLKPQDIEGFTMMLKKLIDSRELRLETGNKALKTARKYYSWELRGNDIFEVYRHVMGKG